MLKNTLPNDVLSKFETACLSSRFKHAYFAKPTPLPAYRVHPHPSFRLILPINGLKKISASIKDEITELNMTSDDILICLKGAWSTSDWTSPNTMLSIVYHDSYTRFLYIDNSAPSRKNQDTFVEKSWHHTNAPSGFASRRIIDILENIGKTRLDPYEAVLDLVQALIKTTVFEAKNETTSTKSRSRLSFESIHAYLHEHYNDPINRESVAAEFRMSPSHLSRLFSDNAHENFNAFLKRIRMEAAAKYLKSTPLPVKHIAESCGIDSVSYFTKQFKKFHGSSPARFRLENKPSSQT